MKHWLWRGVMVVAGVLAWGSDAAAQSHVESAMAARRMTLPKATLRLDNGAYWPIPPGLVETTIYKTPNGHDTFTTTNFGIGIGVIDDLELGFHFIRWDVDPRSDFHDPSAYVIYRFLRHDVELGVFGEVSVPLEIQEQVTAGMPLSLHFGDVVRLDTGPFIYKRFRTGDDPDFIAPLELPISPSDHVYLGPEAGLRIPNFDRSDFFVGFFAGYTLRSRGSALGDIGGRFRIPSTRVGTDVFQLLFELRFYFGL
jgi:hypothetical protein